MKTAYKIAHIIAYRVAAIKSFIADILTFDSDRISFDADKFTFDSTND
jgi:putative flippase GtrA